MELTIRSTKTTILGAAIAAAATLVLAAGCGEKEEGTDSSAEKQRFDLALDFFVNPDHAGIYTALENGHFSEAGLDVRPRVPSDPSAPIKQVAAGDADLAISYEPEVLLARDRGLPVVAVGAIVGQPLTSLISLPKARIDTAADLRGTTIATAGISYQTAFLDSILREEGIPRDDVKQVDVGLGLQPALLSGRADAVLGAFLNIEGVDLAERGLDPQIKPVDELGIPTYDELVLVAGEERSAEEDKAISLFIGALERGTADAIADPRSATDAVLAAGDGLDAKLTAAEIERTLPLLAAAKGEPFGAMDEREWDRFAGFLADQGLIEARPQPGEALTNELLGPG